MAFIGRVRGMILRPRQEWQVIDGEQTSVADLYRGYVVPLAAIANIPMAIGSLLFSPGVPAGSVIAQTIVGFVLSLAIVPVIALAIDQLAPRFGGTRSFPQALKVSAYGVTAAFVTGIFSVVPALGILGILGLYSLYQIHTGLPVLMKAPLERALAYTAVLVVVMAIITAVLSAIYFAAFPSV